MDSLLPSILGFLPALWLCGTAFSFGAALQNLSEKELAARLEAGDKRAGQLLRHKGRPGAFIRSLQLLTILLGFSVGGFCLLPLVKALSERVPLKGLPQAYAFSAVLVYGLAAMIFTAFGTLLPKRLAERNPEKAAQRALFAVRAFMLVLAVPEWLVLKLVTLVLKLCGIDPEQAGENVTEEDIMSMVNEGHEQGVVESDEAQMITNIFRLNDKTAADVMTHRKRVIALDGEMTLGEAVEFLLDENVHSRFPVYRDDIDQIIGILTLRDAMHFSRTEARRDKKISELPGLLRDVHFVPDTRAVDLLFREMQFRKLQMVIVVDEYGQTDGLVSMEDILEEIVGNITDEYDRDEDEIRALPDGTWIMHGFTRLTDAEEASGIPFTEEERENFDTLNGFLIAKLNHFPEDNERASIRAHGFLFQILKAEDRMIKTVKVEWQEEE